VGHSDLTALVIDWGGVLTPALDEAMGAWAVADGVDFDHFRDVMRAWLRSGSSPTHLLERGELPTAQFERLLAGELSARGSVVEAAGLLSRLLAGLSDLDAQMVDAVRRIRRSGFRTALLSNSWGENYPEALWDNLFDSVVISGRVGMRKPEEAIFEHTARSLGVPVGQCVLVDDTLGNVDTAAALGMTVVHHRSVEETIVELERLLDLPLR
jgi:putative hydrolase of the HAD superfamily